MKRPAITVLAVFLASIAHAAAPVTDDAFPVPDGYVLQPLDPTDGKIARPKGWFYKSEGTASGWLLTISAEDPSKGIYETGLRMQLLIGVGEKTKTSPFAVAQKILADKRKSAIVLRECPAVDQGQFKRQCLEVVEHIQRPHGTTSYHILYSVFWGGDVDMVVVNTFGAPLNKWERVKAVSDVMSVVELIGPDFGK